MNRSARVALTMGVREYVGGLDSDAAISGLSELVRFVAGRPIPSELNFEYQRWDAGAGISVVNTETSPTDPEGARITFGGTKTAESLRYNAANTDWYDASRMTDNQLLLQIQKAAKKGVHTLHTNRANRVLTVLNDASNTNLAVSNAATEVVTGVQDAVLAVKLAAAGYCRTRVLFGTTAFQKFANHAKVQGRISGGATKALPATPTAQDVARLIGYGVEVMESMAVINTAAVGATATPGWAAGDVIFVFAASDEPTEDDPAAVKIFEGYDGHGFEPTFGQHDNKRHEKAYWTWYERILAVNPAAMRKITLT